MSGPCWKDRFNEKQLERKRLSDRISQKRARQQSKRSIAELERWSKLLSNGETPRLINHIQQENALLRTKIWRYRSLMENMFVHGRDCLLQDDSSWEDINTTIITRMPERPDLDKQTASPHVTPPSNSSSTPAHPAEKRCVEKMIRIQPSFFVDLAHLIGHSNATHDELKANDILESIMMWKAQFGLLSHEFIVLLISLNLDREPFYLTPEKVMEQAQSKYIFEDIIQNLLYGEELGPRNLQPEDKIPVEAMPKIQYQQRAVAYCAYETCRAWRCICQSSLEYVAIFWAQYRYFMIIAFPTLENYLKCPAWRRPIAKQFSHDHPSIVDFILWPRLRERLVSTWNQYELPDLCVSIVRSLKYNGDQMDVANAIKLQLDSSDVILEESFEQQIHDYQNFVFTRGHFTSQYPELAATVILENPVFPRLGAPQHAKFHFGSLRGLDCPSLVSGLVSQNLDVPQSSSGSQSDSTNGSNCATDTGPPGLLTDTSTDTSSSLRWWAETLGATDLQTLADELGQKWHPENSIPDFLSVLDTQGGETPAHNLHAYLACTDSIFNDLDTDLSL